MSLTTPKKNELLLAKIFETLGTIYNVLQDNIDKDNSGTILYNLSHNEILVQACLSSILEDESQVK